MKKLSIIIGLFLSQLVTAAPDLYKVILKKGSVKMTRQGETRSVFKGDFLLGKDLLETGNDGLVVLGFGEGYASRMKVGPVSELELEGKKQDPENNYEEKTYFFLRLGNILVNYINKNKDKNKLEVQTKSASMAVRGTEFFIHTTADNQTLVAVRSGVVLARHAEKSSGIPLTAEEGVVFTAEGGSGKLNPPSWYKEVNWELSATSKKLEDLIHGEGISKVTLDNVVSKVIHVDAKSVDKLDLKANEAKKWQKECGEGNGESCSELALYLLKNGKISETKPLVMSLFNKGCKLKDARACVWVGRVEYEFGDKDAGKGHILKLCEAKNAYGCFSMWEIEKGFGSADMAQKYRKEAVSIMHGLKDFDAVFSQFEEGCETENKEACLNLGILSEELNRPSKAKEMYQKGCDMGSGASCSNLGFLFQRDGLEVKADKNYTKACFLDEAVGCYNLACSYSKKQKLNLSKQYLRMAIMGGYKDWGHISGDSDLTKLRKDPSYETFINGLKSEVNKPKEKKK